MSYKNRIRLRSVETGAIEECDVELSDSEIKLLSQYTQAVDELEKSRICREEIGVQVNFRYEKGRGISFTVNGPPWDDVIVLLHRLRPLILNDEPFSFLRVRALAGKKLKGIGSARTLLGYLKDAYSGKNMQAQIKMSSNSVLMNSEEMLFTWLNAYEYHRDQEKQKFLETLHGILPLEWSKGIFLSLILQKVRAIQGLALLVDIILGRIDDIQFEL